MLKNYFITAIRKLWRHKTFALINVIGLAIGISASLVIYLVVQHDFNFDKFHKDRNRIYRVVSKFDFSGETFYNSGVAYPLANVMQKEVSGLEARGSTRNMGVGHRSQYSKQIIWSADRL